MANNKKTSNDTTPMVKDLKVKETKVKDVKDVKDVKAVKDVKTSKKVKEVVSTVVDDNVVVAVDVVVDDNVVVVADETVLPTPSENVNTALTEFSTKLQAIYSLISSLKVEYKVLEKNVSREVKIAQKGRRRRTTGIRQPSGFRKPAHITDELAVFLGKEKGSEMARTDVSKEIHGYIKSHNLQDSVNGRNIIPNVELAALLGVTTEDKLTYFNLQKFLKHHFIKTVPVPVPVV